MPAPDAEELADLADRYRAAANPWIDSAMELDRLTEAAERGDTPWQKVDDFRHYRYLADTEAALSAAVQLLAKLGYYLTDPHQPPQ